MTWQNEHAEKFKESKNVEIKCSVKGCKNNSTIGVVRENKPNMFYCDEHRSDKK